MMNYVDLIRQSQNFLSLTLARRLLSSVSAEILSKLFYLSKFFLSHSSISSSRLMSFAVQSSIKVTPSGVVKNVPGSFSISQIVSQSFVALANSAFTRAFSIQTLDPTDSSNFIFFSFEFVTVRDVTFVIVIDFGTAVALLG